MNIDLWKFEFTHWLGICRLLHAVHIGQGSQRDLDYEIRDYGEIQIVSR